MKPVIYICMQEENIHNGNKEGPKEDFQMQNKVLKRGRAPANLAFDACQQIEQALSLSLSLSEENIHNGNKEGPKEDFQMQNIVLKRGRAPANLAFEACQQIEQANFKTAGTHADAPSKIEVKY